MIRRLYRTPIPEGSFRDTGETQRTQLAKLSALTGSGSVESTGTSPGELTLNVQYRGKYAGRLALELSELLHSDGFDGLPYAPETGSAESVSPGRIRPQTDRAVNVDATLARDGTPGDSIQGVATSQAEVANDFGSDQTVHVGIPASASMVRWWDGTAGTEWPSPVATRSAEHGDLEIYDVDAAGFDDPTLLYKPASLDAIGDVDVGAWDTYGADSITDGDGVVQWQRVFSRTHDARGAMVLENGIRRLILDDEAETIDVEEWTGSGSGYGIGSYGAGTYGTGETVDAGWQPIDLPASSWAPIDVDVRHISPTRIEARILFGDGNSRYPLDLILTRGADKVLFARTPNATSATPQGLIDLLGPIAATTIYDAGAEQTLVAREKIAQ